MEPKISIIIPVYNAEKYLGECLSSIIHQTLRAIEIICIDDGSSDNSMKVVDIFAEKDTRICSLGSSIKNYGQAHARNCGIEKARGEYVCFVDADDRLASPDALMTLYQEAVSDDLDGVIFDSTGFYETEGARPLFLGDVVKFGVDSNVVCTGQQLFEQAIMADAYTNVVWQQFWRKDFIQKQKLRFVEDTSPWEDMLFSFQAFMLCRRMKHIPQIFYEYRYQENSSSMGVYTLKKFYSHFRCYYEAVNFLKEYPVSQNLTMACTRFLNQIKNILKERAVYCLQNGMDVHSIKFHTVTENLALALLLTEEYTYLSTPLTLQQFQMLQDTKHIIVYGAGVVGMDAVKLLYRHGFFDFVFAVTKNEQEHKKVYNVALEEIRHLVAQRDDSVVLLAASKLYRDEMQENLHQLGFMNVIVLQ